MKLSEIIGKQVFDIYNAKNVGTIHDACFDDKYKKILGFYFFDQDENEFFLKNSNIYAIGDYITIKNSDKISSDFSLDNPLSPLGKNVIDIDGKDYGLLCDIEFNEKYEVTAFLTNSKQFSLSEILNLLTNVVVCDNKQVKLQKYKPKNKNTTHVNLDNLTVSMMRIESEEQVQELKLMPKKLTVNSDVLLGKKLTKDIMGKNNELILKQNQTITAKQLVVAKQHDKLNELFYSVY